MSNKTLTTGTNDTPISGVTSLKLPRALVNYKADWSVKNSKSDNLVLINKKAEMDQPEQFRLAYSEVANAYKGTGITISDVTQTKKGINILCQLTSTLKSVDAAGIATLLPISSHIVVKVPLHHSIDGQQIVDHIGRLVSGLFDTGSETPDRLNSIIRGALEPSDL